MDIACSTHKGKVRQHNEDSVYFSGSTPPFFAMVADGMGGHAGGQTASTMTVAYIRKKLAEIDIGSVTDEQLKQLAVGASESLIEAAKHDDALKNMGTTLVMAVASEGRVKILNVGDSRAYLLKKGRLHRVTKDHSYVQYLVDNNVLTEEEAEKHPYKHVIMRAIGMENVEADVYDMPFESGDTLLLCSDGLNAHLKDQDMAAVLCADSSSESKAQKLIKTALDRGGSDNVSVVVMENDDMVGRVLQNRYRITEEIAEGGMSHVYAADCKKTGEKVAVKVFKRELMDTPEAVDGFKREAYICSRLHHKNIVHTLDVGRHDKLRYIVMELIEGESLRSIMDRNTYDTVECTDIAVKILDALDYAHSKGVIHKDLKPQNIIMSGGEPILIDFGIAEDTSDKTDGENAVLGTIDYFSPEQAVGEKVDERSDIYSVGIMLYEMTAGRVPFSGPDNVSIALKHLHQPAEPPKVINPEIPESLNKIIMKAISKDKESRYQSAALMANDLRRAFEEPDGDYVHTEEEKKEQEQKKQALSIKRLIIGLSAAVTAIIVAITLMLVFIADTGNDSAIVYMPYLLDKDISDAREVLEQTGMKLNIVTEYDVRLDYEEDKIVGQAPAEGTVLSEGDTVTITVSSLTLKGGIMPNVVGMSERGAVKAIEEAGIEPPTVFYSSGGEHGMVYRQSPGEGETVLGSVVIYVYG